MTHNSISPDIVERLRPIANYIGLYKPHCQTILDAADEIERLLPYVDAFRREETRADKLGQELDDLRATQPAAPAEEAVYKALNEAREELCKTTHHLTLGYKLDGFDYAVEAVETVLLAPSAMAQSDEGECICQDQHRRGYCTEPGCPYSNPLSRSSTGNDEYTKGYRDGWNDREARAGDLAQGALEPLRALAGLFSESAHETWTKDEIVNTIEDAIRLGSTHSSTKSETSK